MAVPLHMHSTHPSCVHTCLPTFIYAYDKSADSDLTLNFERNAPQMQAAPYDGHPLQAILIKSVSAKPFEALMQRSSRNRVFASKGGRG